MNGFSLNEADRVQLKALGIDESQVFAQLELFRKPPFSVRLNRISSIGDGIVKLERDDAEEFRQVQAKAASDGRFLKFVPASGAATRMFKLLFQAKDQLKSMNDKDIQREIQDPDSVLGKTRLLMQNIHRFAFYDALKGVLSRDGFSLEKLIAENHFQPVLEYLLTDKGLNYGNLPKGLLLFHRYPSGSRTAFEEHLVEAANYVRDADGVCRLHFTIVPEHEQKFKGVLAAVRKTYEEQFDIRLQVEFSFQKSSTDTIAVDLENRPMRDEHGRLIFRPGGHGALLENLNDLQGDLVYIKNIDNVVPDALKEETYFWKQVLGGYLVALEAKVHGYVRQLTTGSSEQLLNEIGDFAKSELWLDFPPDYESWTSDQKHSFLLKRLNRPIRVCGVVPNVGEPGGAPFWVKEKDGTSSLQIVEKAQVDFDSPEQVEIWNSSSHFNPVDIVCSLRDYQGSTFDLKAFVDANAVFISTKSIGGRELKALELPGLWNGGMARWITVCAEVPIITFNPVKTLEDLLRPEHQK